MSEEVIKERYNILQVAGGPENYTVDLSMYLVEYAVSPEYWNNVSELNYKGVTSAIDSRYPTIYVPMFGEIADSSEKVLRRVIGHIKLSYDWILQDYKLGMVLYNLSSESYRDMKEIWFHEEIMDYLTRNKVIPQQIFMIRYPSSLWDMHEKIAVIQTATDTVILDLSNSLQLSESEIKTDRAPAYSISEYSVLRKEVEKEAYKEAVGWEENPAGGNLGIGPNNEKEYSSSYLSVGILVGILCVIALAACGVLWFLFHRRKAKGTND